MDDLPGDWSQFNIYDLLVCLRKPMIMRLLLSPKIYLHALTPYRGMGLPDVWTAYVLERVGKRMAERRSDNNYGRSTG